MDPVVEDQEILGPAVEEGPAAASGKSSENVSRENNDEDGSAGEDNGEDAVELASGEEAVRQRIAAGYAAMRDVLAGMSGAESARYEAFRRSTLSRPAVRKVMLAAIEAAGRPLPSCVHPVVPGGGPSGAVSGGALPGPSVGSNAVPPNAVIVAAGAAKVFVGELIEEARAVLEAWGDDPEMPLHPSHILEAHRRLSERRGGINGPWRAGRCPVLRRY